MLYKLPVPPKPNPFDVVSSRSVYESPWIKVRHDEFIHRQGGHGAYSVVSIQHTACGVVAIDDEGHVILVGQWRYPLGQYSWEIPEGGGEKDETPLECIQRELAEECNLKASIWEPLSFFHPSNSKTDEVAFIFLASGLSICAGHPDHDEELQVRREPFRECLERIRSGEITDGLTVTGLLAYQDRLQHPSLQLSEDLKKKFYSPQTL